MTPRETENNAYAKYWGDNQRALWYDMVFSGVVNCHKLVHRSVTHFEHEFDKLQSCAK